MQKLISTNISSNWIIRITISLMIVLVFLICFGFGTNKNKSVDQSGNVCPFGLQSVPNVPFHSGDEETDNSTERIEDSNERTEKLIMCEENVETAKKATENELKITVNPNGVFVANYSELIVIKNDKLITISEKNYKTNVKKLTGCRDKDFKPKILQHGDYTVLRNYIRAEHGEIGCGDSVTYVSHGDASFLDNLIPVLERWNAPLSIALMSAGTDFDLTIKSINYLHHCLPQSKLVRKFATFHLFYPSGHAPAALSSEDEISKSKPICGSPAPYKNLKSKNLYKAKNNLSYPINVARNIAREAALTHYVFVSDIELYPSPNVPKKFLEMIARNDDNFKRPNPKIYPLPIFEISEKLQVPKTKTELQMRYKRKDLNIFHLKICAHCHTVPQFNDWILAKESSELGVFTVAKRTGPFAYWEPIFIGTNDDPIYDERLMYEGADDKMPQGYALCALDYEFHVLDNAFLVHRPGIKNMSQITYRNAYRERTKRIEHKIIEPELYALYGKRKGCFFVGY